MQTAMITAADPIFREAAEQARYRGLVDADAPDLAEVVDQAREPAAIHNPLVDVDPRVRRLAAAVAILAARPLA